MTYEKRCGIPTQREKGEICCKGLGRLQIVREGGDIPRGLVPRSERTVPRRVAHAHYPHGAGTTQKGSSHGRGRGVGGKQKQGGGIIISMLRQVVPLPEGGSHGGGKSHHGVVWKRASTFVSDLQLELLEGGGVTCRWQSRANAKHRKNRSG